MVKVIDVVKRLLPDGSVVGARGDVRTCPYWPPDLFAVAATLLQRTELYTAAWADCLFDKSYHRSVTSATRQWIDVGGNPPKNVQRAWNSVIESSTDSLFSRDIGLIRALFFLLAVSDNASRNMFNQTPPEEGLTPFSYIVINDLLNLEMNKTTSLRHIPSSLGHMIPPEQLKVMPKCNTPSVGVSPRSLSHNLALVPNTVDARWCPTHLPHMTQNHLNILLVPFPFVVHANCFVHESSHSKSDLQYFSVSPQWLYVNGCPVSADMISEMLSDIMSAARKIVGNISGLVLPECALRDSDISLAVDILAETNPDLRFIVSGVINSELSRNSATLAVVDNGHLLRYFQQHKHHPWILDPSQVDRYHLRTALPSRRFNYGEKLDISNRKCIFSTLGSLSYVPLICEDLARIDPVLPFVMAVAPSLVIALLMDGPQWEHRWPGRYATALAEDPGATVLTLTCLGMARRSFSSTVPERMAIGLWKEPGRPARELEVKPDEHALVISLKTTTANQFTLDRRRQRRERYALEAAVGVSVPALTRGPWPEL